MNLSVEEVVNLPILKPAKVITGKDQLKNYSVEWVSAIEGTVENFVREKEFVLTMGMGCENNPTKLLSFVRDVQESGASALGIATGRYIFEIPNEVMSFAEEKNFILIELPWEIRFADIQQQTMNKINEWQEDVSKQSRMIQKRLIDLVVQGKDLSTIVKYVEAKLGWSIVFTDDKGRITAGGSDPKEMIRLWDELEEKDGVSVDEPLSHHMQRIQHDGRKLLKKEISAGGVSQGSFIVLFPANTDITSNVLHILEYLSAAAALWISREDAIVKTENRLRNDFIWNLAKTPNYYDETLHTRAKLFGYNLLLPYICMIGYSENIDELSEDRYDHSQYGLKSLIYYIEEEIRYAGKVVDRQVAFTFDDDQLIVFLETDDTNEPNSIHYFLDLVEKRLNALIPGVIFSWGIGMHEDGVMHFHDSYKKAKSALEMGRQQKGIGQRVNFEDTRLNRLLLNLAQNDEIQEIVLSTIHPLVQYDKKRDADLIETFIVYVNQNSNVSRAARILNLHRQSLLYRLRKIETLTNLSLVNPDDVFLLNFSIKVWLTGVLKT
ncbi:PucR family transcriptional regulator [Ornithinibacillus halophilus]|uniref:Purine catabolism regulatory protein n=1 Tax=Ornithinibacillus halophilus TaxID=930117 RepID=A0A1M5MKA1_9BACI|nr:PucR family transcriptional regulator [Ornithinibacillus halophilus]SHG77339.1 purine catabolism regulatory protein [Ornithinibacillus halophilus]